MGEEKHHSKKKMKRGVEKKAHFLCAERDKTICKKTDFQHGDTAFW